MKSTILRVTLALLLMYSQDLFAQLHAEVDGVGITFPDMPLEHFLLTVDSNKVSITPVAYELPEGQVQFSMAPEKLEVKYKLGFVQYTIDDSPASPLSFVHWTEYHTLKTPVFPNLHKTDKNAIDAHALIGYDSRQNLANSVFSQNQKEITEESMYIQEVGYVNVLRDSSYMKCCPEYIRQAKEFMKAEKASLNSLDKLNLELVYKTAVLRATFLLKDRKKEIKIIIKMTPDQTSPYLLRLLKAYFSV
ncbi:MAG: hypothetical protein Roseis2KO_58960 [Roseivirga sp.]